MCVSVRPRLSLLLLGTFQEEVSKQGYDDRASLAFSSFLCQLQIVFFIVVPVSYSQRIKSFCAQLFAFRPGPIMLVIMYHKEGSVHLFCFDHSIKNSEVGGGYGGKVQIEPGLIYINRRLFRVVRPSVWKAVLCYWTHRF